MITLTDEQERRAHGLHYGSLVHDFSPFGEPFVMTDRHRRVMREGIEAKHSQAIVRRQMALDRLRELSEDKDILRRVHKLWEESGVNSVQVTLGSMEVDFCSWEAVVRDAARWYARTRIDDMMAICTGADEIESAYRRGQVALTFGLQDASPVGRDLERVETLYNLGVRVIQLTYNTRNLVGDGCLEREQGGLSRFGTELVRTLDDLGIIVDLSHCGLRTTMDAIELSCRPVAFTHVSCNQVCEHPRGKSDEEMKLLAQKNGYVGILAAPHFLKRGGGATVEDILRHLDHAVSLMGVQRVGIGTDWAFWSTDMPEELQMGAMEEIRRLGFRPEEHGNRIGVGCGEFYHWTDWYQITRGIVARGYSDEVIRGFLGANWLSFIRRAVAA